MPYVRFRPEAGPSTKTAQHRAISTFVSREHTAARDRTGWRGRGSGPEERGVRKESRGREGREERGERGGGAGAVMK
ncbi:hypothetical protein HEK616_13570 [Streptomyces nigrescens]|uniref:Uncharacterized protein n=1 Tax=Streptomyces nigrescens TaxID=1920 RepID=A0ABN6QPJ8_STRNI|nr:hypothetical protein HEK616_13570 [Streptomyces nigrescens]